MNNYYGIGLGGPINAGKPPPATPAQIKAAQRAQMTPQQRKSAEAQDKIRAENEAAKQRIAARETEATPFTIPGQEDTRVLFQKAQKRAPNAGEQAELKKYVKAAGDVMTAGAGGPPGFTKDLSDEEKQKLFIGIVSRLQFFLDHLKEPRGKEVDEINAQTIETMEANAYAKQFVMDGEGTEAEPVGDKRGWHWPRFDTLEFFRKTQNREPTQAEEKILIKFVKAADDARARGASGDTNAEKTFDGMHRRAAFFAQNLREARGAEVNKINNESDEIVSKHVRAYYAAKPKGLRGEIIDWGHTASKGFNAFKQLPGIKQLTAVNDFIVHGAAEYYKQMGAAAGNIPFVGSGIQAGFGVFGGDELAAMDAINRGANVSDETMGALKKSLANAAVVSDYITAITAFVPGFAQIGAGISGAIVAASAMASGKSITDALIAAAEDAAMSMIPAGKFAGLAKKVAQGAFQMARVMVAGGSMEAGAEAALIKNLPGGDTAQKAVTEALKVAKAVAGGKPLDKIALDELRAHLPADVLKAFDTGLAFAQGKKIQAIVAENMKSLNIGADQIGKLADQGSHLVKLSKDFRAAAEDLKGSALKGFNFATGVLARSGVLPDTLKSLRTKLGPEGRRGFDRALAAHGDVAAKLGPIKVLAPTQTAPVKPPATQGPRPFDGSVPVPLTQEQRDLQALAKLTPAQQKQLVEYANLQKLAKLTPAQQQQLVAYAKAIAATPATQAALRVAATTPSLATPGPAKPATPGPAKPATPARASEASKTAALSPSVAASAYPPYPPHLTGALSAPPPHPHPGGRHHPGRHPGVFRGGRAVPGWWNSWGGTQVVTTTETCRIWGDPVEIPQSMQVSAKVALGASGGRPTTLRGEDGVLYLFTSEGGGIVARPCAAMAGALGDPGTTWGPVTTDMSREMRWAGMSAVNGTKGRPRMVIGPDGADYLFAMENGTLTARRAV